VSQKLIMQFLSQIKKEDLAGKTCLLRVNLDIKNPEKDSSRLEAAIPTVKFLLENGAKPLILSHRGRPQAENSNQIDLSKFTLEPLVKILSERVGQKIDYLENLRLDPREQENDETFAKELASKGDIYINDDFATSCRANASVSAITKFLPSYAGLWLEKEIKNLEKAIINPQKPLVVIIGGVKFDDKLGMVKNFQDKADFFLVGSAYVDLQDDLLKNPKVIMPTDWTGESNLKLDIGPKTIEQFCKIISTAKTVIWNGPLGMFEDLKYLEGSKKIAEAIISSGAFSIIGGGDTDQLLNQLKIKDKFSFVSTGGASMLAFLAGDPPTGGLPGLEALG